MDVSLCFHFLPLSYIYFSECDNTLIRAGTVWQQCTSTISGYYDQGDEEQRCHLNTPCELGIASHSNISNKTMTKTCYADCNFQQQASADGTDIPVEDSCPAQFPYEKTKTCQEFWTSSENQYNNGLCYVANQRVLCPGIDESPALLATKKTQQYEFCKSYDNSQCVTNSTTEKKENVGCATSGNSSNTTTGATVQSPSPSPAPTETKNDEPTSICRMQKIFVGKSENDGCADRKGNEFMGSPCSDQTDPTLCLKHGQSKDGSECCYVETKPFCQMKVEFVDMNQNGGCADRKATNSMGSPCSEQTDPKLCLKHGQSTSGSECCEWIGDTTVVTVPSPSLKEIKTTPSSADEDLFIFDEDSLNVGLVIGLSSSIGITTLLLLVLTLV